MGCALKTGYHFATIEGLIMIKLHNHFFARYSYQLPGGPGLFLAFSVSAAAAQDAAAIRRGEALVNRDCSRCHATARTGQPKAAAIASK
jgi:cytochrome c553